MVALAIPAAAYAGSQNWSGSFVNGQGQMFFYEDTGSQEAEDFVFLDLPLNCEGSEKTISGELDDMDLNNRKFSNKIVVGPRDNPRFKIKVKGELPEQEGDVATGFLKIKGRKVPTDQGGERRCTSGKNSWSATGQG
jgi:hypothetical protein